MTAIAETPVAAPRSASNGWWGMVLLIATEATLFAVLLVSYFYIRFRTSGGWPPGGIDDPKLLRASLMTVLLASSSLFVHAAEAGIRRGSQRALVAGLLLVAWIQVRAWFGAYSPRRHLGVQMAAIYWHFVVVAQLAIFATLSLSPRL